MMESEWSQEQVIYLIDLYRERPVLWDPTNSDFKDRNLKNYAWTEIGQALRMTKVEVRNKMAKVIGQFQRETKKQKSGSGTITKVKWFCYDHLLFLKDKTVPRSTSEVGLDINEHEEEDEDNRETEDEETQITPAPPPQVGAAQALAPSVMAAKRVMAPPQAPKAAQPKKRKTNQMMAEEAYGVMNRIEKKIQERDHCEVFGEHVAHQLRQIKDRRLQMVAKHRISQVLFEIGMSEFEPSDATPSPGSLLEETNSPKPSMYPSMSPHDADPESTQLHATNIPTTSDFCDVLNFTQL